MKLLFNDNKMCASNTVVAGIGVEQLVEQASLEFEVQRVTNTQEQFDRAVLHLDEGELNTLIDAAQHSFLALLLTTDPGIPVSRRHHIKENPLTIVLAVRRMAAFAHPAVWKAFLLASASDCMAIAQGRLGDVADDAKPMLRLFLEREEALPALKILCVAFEETHKRAATGEALWENRANDTQRATWWLQAMDHVLITVKTDTGKPETKAWAEIRKALPNEAVKLLLERMSLEATRWTAKDSETKLGPLLKALAQEADVTLDHVAEASLELSRIMD